jgi:hypothetical protein
MCATLTRYDGWAILATGFLVVVGWSTWKERRHRSSEATILIFGAMGGFGIGLWVLYNLIIFGDPLSFIHSSFSAQSQQVTLQHAGTLATRGSLSTSGLTYAHAVLDVAGSVLTIVGVIGVTTLLFRNGRPSARGIVLTAVLAAPIAFNVVSLWAGQSTLRVPEMAPYDMWNVRYGLMALPLLAIGAAALVGGTGPRVRGVLGILAAGLVIANVSAPITLADGRTGTSSATGGHPELVAAYLHDHYAGGRILADEASSAPLIFASGLSLSDFVTIGYHPYWERALEAPVTNVEWVVAYDGDVLADAIQGHPDRYAGFDVVLKDGRAELLRRMHANP